VTFFLTASIEPFRAAGDKPLNLWCCIYETNYNNPGDNKMTIKINIIGAGVAGLAVGCYLQMNGFDTEIFEMHDRPGGLCTAWSRKGYTFDGCIHWLIGSSPGSNMHEMWRELHAVQDREFVEWEEYARIRTRGGELFTIFTDPHKLEAEMLRVAPEDSEVIRSICGAIRKVSRADMPVTAEKMGLFERLGYILPWLSFGAAMKRWSSTSISALCSRLKSPVLAEVLRTMFGGEGSNGDMPMIAMIIMLGFMHKGSCGYPIGGSLEFARAIERRYIELGGRIRYNARVEKILVENDRAVGIRCNGEEHRCHEVISCADGRTTLFDMLEGKHLSDEQREAYQNYPLFPSLIYVSLGIGRDLGELPHVSIFPLKKNIVLEDGALTLKQLGLRLFTFDPTMAPAGKTAGIVMIESRGIDYWNGLRSNDPARYKAEKERIGELVIEALEGEFGGIKEHVEVVDVATPATWQRYTGNWKGSFEGFLPTRKTMARNLGFTVPGLANFHMHGQWVAVGGGLPPAGTNGRIVARKLCKKYGKRFRTVP
jgi:phytoene dehydrogenase-like protein